MEIIILIIIAIIGIFFVFKLVKQAIMIFILFYIVFSFGLVDSETIEKYDEKFQVSSKLKDWSDNLGISNILEFKK